METVDLVVAVTFYDRLAKLKLLRIENAVAIEALPRLDSIL